MDRKSERGSALLTAVVVILIITVIGVGVVRFAHREVAGASAGARQQALVACAEAARALLLSKFRATGAPPVRLDALNVALDGAAQRTLAVGGHYDTVETGVSVTQVAFLPESSFGPTTAVRDLSNIVTVTGQGGKPMKIVVHCQDHSTDGTATGGRQLEVEFGLRFGL